jgi:hypothetical protein
MGFGGDCTNNPAGFVNTNGAAAPVAATGGRGCFAELGVTGDTNRCCAGGGGVGLAAFKVVVGVGGGTDVAAGLSGVDVLGSGEGGGTEVAAGCNGELAIGAVG